MKHLKLFEAYIKEPVNSQPPNSPISYIDIDGYKTTIIDCRDVPGHKAIYSVESKTGYGYGYKPVCFSDIELAKDYIKKEIQRDGFNDERNDRKTDVIGFMIRKMMLDLVDVKSEKGDDDGEPINSNKIYDYIEKYINVLVDAYVAITPQRYKATFTKDVIRRGLVRLQQECKFNDLKRTKEAIGVFNDSMKPMMDDVLKSKNIETWKLGSNGKKYYNVFNDFRNMVNLV